MTIIERRWQELASAVIARAIYDVKCQGNRRLSPPSAAKSAKAFLDNSPELEFYADMAGKRNEMINAGFLKED